ncbi:hypothetical protein EYF80_001644 [Liparis tanakae]|uniref:Uncharacterized protein n=1 Tax=Liparis tanakae TaxID=230148 RepID=A0A4Z2JE71_9TELE|nr:hypothetical protein EYF80_001644 [Liparis tanakae]
MVSAPGEVLKAIPGRTEVPAAAFFGKRRQPAVEGLQDRNRWAPRSPRGCDLPVPKLIAVPDQSEPKASPNLACQIEDCSPLSSSSVVVAILQLTLQLFHSATSQPLAFHHSLWHSFTKKSRVSQRDTVFLCKCHFVSSEGSKRKQGGKSFIPLRPFMGKLISLETADTGSRWTDLRGKEKVTTVVAPPLQELQEIPYDLRHALPSQGPLTLREMLSTGPPLPSHRRGSPVVRCLHTSGSDAANRSHMSCCRDSSGSSCPSYLHLEQDQSTAGNVWGEGRKGGTELDQHPCTDALQRLCLCWAPVLHVTLHLDHSPHSSHRPSTGQREWEMQVDMERRGNGGSWREEDVGGAQGNQDELIKVHEESVREKKGCKGGKDRTEKGHLRSETEVDRNRGIHNDSSFMMPMFPQSQEDHFCFKAKGLSHELRNLHPDPSALWCHDPQRPKEWTSMLWLNVPTLTDISGRYGNRFIGMQLSDAAVIRNERAITETVGRLRDRRNRRCHDVVVWADTSRLCHPTTISIRSLLAFIVTSA